LKAKLITLAIAAALPLTAMADTTLYGSIKAGVEKVDHAGLNQTNIDDMESYIGFKGSEDVGDGLKAIWQVEAGFNIDGTQGTGATNGTFANRDSFVGLQSNYGTLRLGHLSTYQNDSMEDVDPWTYSSDALGLGIFTRTDGRMKNAVRYDSPNLAGFNASLAYGANESNYLDQNGDKRHPTGDIYNVGLGYSNSGFFGKYSYLRQNGSDLSKGTSDSHRFEGGYNANNLLLAVGYQQTKGFGEVATTTNENWLGYVKHPTLNNTDELKTREYTMTASYTMGNVTPRFSYAHGQDMQLNGVSQNDTSYDQYVVGADYTLSKRTKVGASVGKIDFKGDNSDVKAVGINLTHNF